jgi:hypothetical protein
VADRSSTPGVVRARKRPVTVEVVRLTFANRHQIAEWCGGHAEDPAPSGTIYAPGILSIPTLEGMMWAADGDWIIRGVAGEFYPCKPDIFEATYQDVCECPPEDEQPWHDSDCPQAHDELGSAWSMIHQLADVLQQAGAHLHDGCAFAVQIKSNLDDYEFFRAESEARAEAVGGAS